MKRLILGILCASTLSACGDTSVDNSNNVNNNNNNNNVYGGDEGIPIEAVGPDHDAYVPLADADIWNVPPLNIDITPDTVVWTLTHPKTADHAYIRRFCSPLVPEPYLWLREPEAFGGELIAILRACEDADDFYSTVELAYNGAHWIGLAATGTATLVPPLP